MNAVWSSFLTDNRTPFSVVIRLGVGQQTDQCGNGRQWQACAQAVTSIGTIGNVRVGIWIAPVGGPDRHVMLGRVDMPDRFGDWIDGDAAGRSHTMDLTQYIRTKYCRDCNVPTRLDLSVQYIMPDLTFDARPY